MLPRHLSSANMGLENRSVSDTVPTGKFHASPLFCKATTLLEWPYSCGPKDHAFFPLKEQNKDLIFQLLIFKSYDWNLQM